jgi:hypothetical protein
MNLENYKKLTQIGYKYDTDKSYFHLFTEFYHDFFEPWVDKEFNLLEIGICNGSSLKMLHEFFPRAHIYAIDINEPSVYRYYGDNIHTSLCSQTDIEGLKKVIGGKKFDIIIDDGSHMTSHQQISLGFLFPYLISGGIYVCEDIHTSLHSTYIDSKETTLDIFLRYQKTGIFENNLMKPSEVEYLRQNIKQLEIYTKNQHALKCYSCKTPNVKKNASCDCGVILDYNVDKSITSILTHK